MNKIIHQRAISTY